MKSIVYLGIFQLDNVFRSTCIDTYYSGYVTLVVLARVMEYSRQYFAISTLLNDILRITIFIEKFMSLEDEKNCITSNN